LQDLLKGMKDLQEEIEDLSDLLELAEEDESIQQELEERVSQIREELDEKELHSFLDGPYDQGGAIISIYSGAGGREAEDWAAMLARMYRRYAEQHNFKVKILDQSFGEPGGPEGRTGLKSITMEIEGDYAFGYLKNETGVHRLVRVSPFSEQNLRHTSFALVEVLPQLSQKEVQDVEIEDKNIRVDTFRASGPGGQYVNRRESAVRIVHKPTGITVSCQAERTQGANRQKALQLLKTKLHQRREKERQKHLEKLKSDVEQVAWGNQIRSYILHPYKLVKDHRTEVEVKQPQQVLNGNLNSFIEAEIKLHD